MGSINSVSQLRESIKALEEKSRIEKSELKKELSATAERLKPVNLVKNMLQEYAQTPDLNETIGLAAGYLTKKTIVGSSDNPVKQIVGTLVQMAVSKLISKNSEGLKNTIVELAQRFFNKGTEKK